MKKRRALVIGAPGAIWTKRFIEHILLADGYEVVVFPIWGKDDGYADFYREHGVIIYEDTHRMPVIRHIPKLRIQARIWLNARSLKQYGPFDVVHNQYLSPRDLALGKRMARFFGARWVCCFWGSDLLRASRKTLQQMKKYLLYCDAIHSDYGQLVEYVRRTMGEEVARKSRVVEFGHVGYRCIDAVRAQADKAACKAHFGINPESFVVCVGYSAAVAQQQLKVLQTLSELPQEQLEKIALVVQQTYCKDNPAYMQQVRDYAAAMPCASVVMTEFMDDMETAWLRLASDMFILAITTDAFCATLSEYLYAGAIVVRGDWLVYQQLIDMGITLPTFHEFGEIPELVRRALTGELQPLSQADRDRFPPLYSWDAVRPDWLKLYEA